MERPFENQVAFVTGAASGIGRATALLFAQRGASVVVADVDPAGRQETISLIANAGGTAIDCHLDVTSEEDWSTAIDLVREKWKRLDILVNCAGVSIAKSIAETSLPEWRRVLAINLDGVFLGTRAAAKLMRESKRGCIVNVASASGIKAAAFASAYCASKAAVLMFTRCSALEFLQDGIRVNAVAPGGVKTPMWAKSPEVAGIMDSEEWKASKDAPISKRFAEPEEIAEVIAFLASPQAAYITGSVLPVDAGYTA